MKKEYNIHPKTKIGHIHLSVSNLDRSIEFYNKLLGFNITQKYGDSAAFLSAGSYHHHIGLNTWNSKNGKPASNGHTGLYHFAILYPTRKELAKIVKRLIDAKYPIDGMSDHGVSEAVYLRDPDNNGIELYWDKPKKLWPKDKNGNLSMKSNILDIDLLLSELKK